MGRHGDKGAEVHRLRVREREGGLRSHIQRLQKVCSNYIIYNIQFSIPTFSTHCSFSDVTTEAIEVDTFKLLIGFALMFCYTMFMLGKLNAVEHRTYLAMTGDGLRQN